MIAFYKRIAVRDGDDQAWRWFRPPIAFSLKGHMTDNGPVVEDDAEAYRQLEDQLAEAVFYRPTSYIRVIQAQRLDAFGELDLETIM